MVTKLENNKEYIDYIRNRMEEELPYWEEKGLRYKNQINNNFQIDFMWKNKELSFIKDRGLLHVNEYGANNRSCIGNLIYDSILEYIPFQNPRWRLSICTELIDYYIDFIKRKI